MKIKAPFKSFSGQAIYEGDCIIHPSGEVAKVRYIYRGTELDNLVCDYGDGGPLSRLCLQVGDKGRAVRLSVSEEEEIENEN